MRLKTITATKKYHSDLYNKMKLFEKGSWLEKPDRAVINLIKKFTHKKNVKVLDLGSGVGRHTIPIAEIIGKNNGKVICVDYLKIADKKLRKNAEKYRVEKYIESYVCDVGEFKIKEEYFDFILAPSVLEHLQDQRVLKKVIKNMIYGTRKNGYNYIYLTTELEEIEISTKNQLKSQIEIDLTTKNAKKILKEYYSRWKVLTLKIVPYEEIIKKDRKNILWKCKYLLLIAKR